MRLRLLRSIFLVVCVHEVVELVVVDEASVLAKLMFVFSLAEEAEILTLIRISN